MKISLFAFIAAVVIFIARSLASKADPNGYIFIPTPKQLYKRAVKYGKRIKICIDINRKR